MVEYYVYILTNKNKTVIYTGVTNNLRRRLIEHKEGKNKGFTKRYNCYHLLYCEKHNHIKQAIAREKEIKGWRRSKKRSIDKYLES